jgi:hypothetical protein
MTMYAPPYALRITTQQRDRRRAVCVHEFGAVADHPAPFEVAAGLEAGRVDERDDREVEVVAPRHEPRGLARRAMSSVPALLGWFATTPIGRPSRQARPVTRFGACCGRSSKKKSPRRRHR